jgi:hypothetical protein
MGLTMELKLRRLSVGLRIHKGFFRLVGEQGADIGRPNYHMFVEDVGAGVLPYGVRGGRAGGPAVELQVDPAILQTARDRLGALSPGSRRGGARIDVEDIVRYVGERLPWTGRFLIDMRCADSDHHHRFGVAECYDPWTPRIGRFTVQVGFSRADKCAFLFHIGAVPTADIYEARIPEELGGIRGYSRLLRRLDRFSELGPTHWRRQLESGEADWRFDFARYRRTARTYRERAARVWGWSGRDSSAELKTEFFTVFRYLRMRRACALVRQSILDSLSAVLSRSGIEGRITVNGLPSAEAIEQAILQLERGAISLEDAYKLVST